MPKKLTLVFLAVFLAFAGMALSDEHVAASLSPADIQTAATAAVAGDVVVLPAGNYSGFNTSVSMKAGVSLRGAGIDQTILTQTAYTTQTFFTWNSSRASTSYLTEISDFKCIGPALSSVSGQSSTGIGIYLNSLSDIYVHDIWIENKTSVLLGLDGCAKGVICDSTFKNCISMASYGSGGYGVAVKGAYYSATPHYRWPDSYPAYGTENAIFIEDCDFASCRHSVMCQDTGYYVFRHNRIGAIGPGGWGPHGFIDMHGARSTEEEDSSGLQYEVYENDIYLTCDSRSTFYDAVAPTYLRGYGANLRGGRGVFYNNRFHKAGGDSTIDNQQCIMLLANDITTHTDPAYSYPGDYTNFEGTGGPPVWFPMDFYVWNNTWEGGAAPEAVEVIEGSDWFEEDRLNGLGFYDYKNEQKVGYVPYTNPHPYRGEEEIPPEIPVFPEGWEKRKMFTVDHTNIDVSLTNFPLYFELDADADIGVSAQNDGDDIRFSVDGVNTLPYKEIYWNVSGGEATAKYRVQIDLSSAADTQFYVYYDNSGASDGQDTEGVWDSYYMLVQLGNDETTSTIDDETSNDNNGTKKGANEPIETDGLLYKAQDFDGADDYINFASGSTIDNLSSITYEALVYLDGWGEADYTRIFCKEATASNQYATVIRTSLHAIHFLKYASTTSATSITANDTLSLGAWTHIAVKYNNTSDRLGHVYINGTEASYASQTAASGTTFSDSAYNLSLGNRLDGTKTLDGKVDFFAVSNTVRSDSWIKFAYHNLVDADHGLTGDAPPEVASYLLTVTKSGTGTGVISSSPSGIYYGADDTETLLEDTVVWLTAVADEDSEFTAWSGDVPVGHETDNPVEITMTAALTIDAEFTSTAPTTWYINQLADPGGDGTTTALTGAHCPFQTIAAGQAAVTGDQHGNSLLIARGTPAPEYREQYTAPAYGTTVGQFTFGAYGTGDDPIISGAEIVTPGSSWAATSAWMTNFTQIYSSDSGDATNHNVRNLIPANTFSYSGTKIRITLLAHTGNLAINGASIGVSTTYPTFDATPTRITFSSGNTTTITAGNSVVSDEMTYSYDKTQQVLIHLYYTGNGPNNIVSGSQGYGYKGEYASGTDKTLETSLGTVGYTSTNQTRILTKLEVYNTLTNVWQTALETEAGIVSFNEVVGQGKASLEALTSARDYYWVSDVLYVYAASDPDTLYTSPGVEVGQRDYCIYGVGKSYITIDGLTLEGANNGAITMAAASGIAGGNWTVQNCEMRNSLFGFGIYPYSTTQFGGSNLIDNNTIHDMRYDSVNAYPHKGSGSGTETVFSNNEIYNCHRFGGYFRVNYWIIENNEFYSNGTSGSPGIAIEIQSEDADDNSGQNNIIRYNTVRGQQGDNTDAVGILLDHWATGNQVYYNLVYGNYGIGIGVYNATSQSIYNNVVYGNCLNTSTSGPAEIKLYGDGGATIDNIAIKNNIGYATETGVYAINVQGSYAIAATLDITNNIWYRASGNWYFWNATGGATLATWNALTGVGTDLNSDPTFTNPATPDFTLQVTSPCINAGTDVGLTEDYAGNPVPYDTLFDIGAFEYMDYVPELDAEIYIFNTQTLAEIADAGSQDFGTIDAGESVPLTFTIANTGTAALALGGTPIITIAGTNADQFSVSDQPDASVAAADSTTFGIIFSPTSAGSKTATIAIANDDSDENPYNITFTGTGSMEMIITFIKKYLVSLGKVFFISFIR